MRAALIVTGLVLTMCTPVLAQKLYRHVDEKGNVSFSDRPQQAGQKAEKPNVPNVASPEERRQLQYGEYASQREEQAERAAQQQRHYAQRRREAEAERERRAKEADPYSPPQDGYRPRVRR
jgi:uncharacterized protein DUF4124